MLNRMIEGLIVLRNFPDEIQAELAKGLLVSQSIEAFIRRIDSTIMSPLDEVIRGVDLLIHAEDQEKATKVLAVVVDVCEVLASVTFTQTAMVIC